MSSQEAKVDAIIKMIKNLPDDMIREIKGYVISPYKFIPELKLYKFPVYKYRISNLDNNMVLESINQSRGLVYDTNHSTYEKNYILDMLLHIGMGLINYNELKELLKNLKIKGRTKLILWKTYEGGDWETTAIRRKQAIAHAIMKSNN
mgnify:FL=1